MTLEFQEGKLTHLPSYSDLYDNLEFDGKLDGIYDITGRLWPIAENVRNIGLPIMTSDIEVIATQPGLSVIALQNKGEFAETRIYLPTEDPEHYISLLKSGEKITDDYLALSIKVENPRGLFTFDEKVDKGIQIAPLSAMLKLPHGRFANNGDSLAPPPSVSLEYPDHFDLSYIINLWFPLDVMVSNLEYDTNPMIPFSVVAIHPSELQNAGLMFKKMDYELTLVQQGYFNWNQ